MTMPCHVITPKLVSYVAGDLTLPERAAVEAHLHACPSCADDARVLAEAYGQLPSLPVRAIPLDVVAIEAAARRRQGRLRAFFALPSAASVVLLLCVLALAHRPAPRQIARPVIPRVTAAAGLGDAVRVPPLPLIKVPATPPVASPPPQQRAELVPPPAVRAVITQAVTPPVATSPVIARYVATLSRCVAGADAARPPVTCALLPIMTADADDLPLADTVTAALIHTFQEQAPGVTLQRLPPADASAPALQADTLAFADTVAADTDEFVILGKLSKAESGYVLSLYAVNTRARTVVFDGGHPFPLPPDLLPQSRRTAALARTARLSG